MKPIDMIKVSDTLISIGIDPALRGYWYLKEAISVVYDMPVALHKMTTYLYPEIAKRCGSSPRAVEHAIRHSIERCFDKGSYAELIKYFGNAINTKSGKVTNTTFIATVVERLRIEELANERKAGDNDEAV